jgi:predicted dehydrogenase
MLPKSLLFVATLTAVASAFAAQPDPSRPVKLILVDPGHFHAALLQKTMYPQIDPMVHIYAPAGPDVQEHLKRVDAYNKRPENPTSWKATTVTGPDFLVRMLTEKRGNVVVLSGNNRGKVRNIQHAVGAGLHVFADKPVIIEPEDFEPLKQAFATAREKGVLIYDIMTERSPIATVLQREFSRMPEIFGQLEKGTPDNPAIVMESVHYFHKTVSGLPLKRPAWFFDVAQEGEGITDVGTHLVDLVQWQGFPDQVIDYAQDIEVLSARRWPTALSPMQFVLVTGMRNYPEYLKKNVQGSTLNVYANGELTYRIKGVHAKVTAKWEFDAPEGSGDTHYALFRGTKCNLVVRQGPAEKHKPTLYLEAAPGTDPIRFRRLLAPAMVEIQRKYRGVDVRPLETSWQVIVPDDLDQGHEAHFAEVTERFLKYLAARKLPEWEEPNMLAKYYTTTKAVELARRGR